MTSDDKQLNTFFFGASRKTLIKYSLAATGGAAVGLAVLPGIGLVAAALVPASMATFGTVVAGVGTIHAPLSAFGVSAILQATSIALATFKAASIGAAGGSLVGYALVKNEKNSDSKANKAKI